jgi:hypothetical protein
LTAIKKNVAYKSVVIFDELKRIFNPAHAWEKEEKTPLKGLFQDLRALMGWIAGETRLNRPVSHCLCETSSLRDQPSAVRRKQCLLREPGGFSSSPSPLV